MRHQRTESYFFGGKAVVWARPMECLFAHAISLLRVHRRAANKRDELAPLHSSLPRILAVLTDEPASATNRLEPDIGWITYVTFAFQKTGAPNLRISQTFFRKAVGWTHSPHGTYGTSLRASFWISSANCLRLV